MAYYFTSWDITHRVGQTKSTNYIWLLAGSKKRSFQISHPLKRNQVAQNRVVRGSHSSDVQTSCKNNVPFDSIGSSFHLFIKCRIAHD